MISFEEGYAKILALASPLDSETVKLENAVGRVLASSLQALRDQPSQDISAMDGYALSGEAESYSLVGEVAAGQNFDQTLKLGEAVRIFTGAPIPEGADRVLIQENAIIQNDKVIPNPLPLKDLHIRKQGGDFSKDFTLTAPRQLNPADIALLASMNYGEIPVTRKPRIIIFATGNELVLAGDATNKSHVIASNSYGLKAMIENAGGEAVIASIIKDDPDALSEALLNASDYDVIVTTGGASVGKYDFTAESAKAAGFDLALHKIALRPGKPIMAGKKGDQIFLGLPGNPVSAMICAELFLRALIMRLLGHTADLPKYQKAKLKSALEANGDRTHFMRAIVSTGGDNFEIEAFKNQDSATLTRLSLANALLVLPPHAEAKAPNDWVDFLFLNSPF